MEVPGEAGHRGGGVGGGRRPRHSRWKESQAGRRLNWRRPQHRVPAPAQLIRPETVTWERTVGSVWRS